LLQVQPGLVENRDWWLDWVGRCWTTSRRCVDVFI